MIPFGAFAQAKTHPVFRSFLDGPALHSSVFFLLGGFLYHYKYRDSKPKLWIFIKQRLKRLWPFHALTTLLSAAMTIFHIGIYPRLFGSLLMHLSLVWAIYPWGTYSLNEPSWALQAFFVAYLLFPLWQRFVKTLQAPQTLGWIAVLIWFQYMWGLVYSDIPYDNSVNRFFHVFAPVRALEFLFGMLLARLWVLRQGVSFPMWGRVLFVVSGFTLALGSNSYMFSQDPDWKWVHHHSILPVFHAMIIWGFASGHTTLPGTSWCTKPWIKTIAKESFTVYLLHSPLLALCRILSKALFDNPSPFASTIATSVFVVAIYALSVPGRRVLTRNKN